MLECPPGVETITLVFTRPFSAMPGTAMVEPPISPYAPERTIKILKSSLSTQHSPPSSTSRANASSPYNFSIAAERCWAPWRQQSQAYTPAYRRLVLMTCLPPASSSKPKARTTVRAALNPFSSKLSIDALSRGQALQGVK